MKMNEQEKMVLAYVEEHRDDMIRFLRKLVEIDTQTPPGLNYDVICDVLADKLSGGGWERQAGPRTLAK